MSRSSGFLGYHRAMRWSTQIARLSVEDQTWLSDCNALLIAESIRENETEIAQGMSRMLDLLENALKEEKKNLKEG